MQITKPTNRNKSNKGLYLVLATALISGISIFVNGLFISKVNPSTFAFLKNGITALAIFALIVGTVLFTKNKQEILKLKPVQWLQLALIGLIGGSVPFLLFFNGLSQVGGASASLIHKSMFVFVLILSPLFLKEKINRWIFPLAIILLISNELILGIGKFSFQTGHLLVLAATILWAIENIISKKVLTKLSGSVVAFGRMFFGAIFIFIYLLLTGEAGSITTLSADQWIVTTIASLFLIGYVLTWYTGLKTVPATLATTVLLLGSPVTTLLNSIFLQKTITLAQATGILLTIGAITAWIVIEQPQKQHLNIKESSRKHIHSGS